MASSNLAKSLQLVLAHEGGYVNHPKDPGGATNKGVTQKVYDAYRVNHGEDARSVKLISDTEVKDIYKKQYWDAVKADRLPAGVDYAMFDYGVNSGPSRAVKDLQRALNDNANLYGISGKIAVDGVIGESTIAATCLAANADEAELIKRLCERRVLFLKSLRTWATFGKGWNRRVNGATDGVQDGDNGVVDYATAMARNDLAYPIPVTDLPTAIGTRSGEEAGGKGTEATQAALKTKTGLGSALAAAGAGGQTLVGYAQQIQPHIGETVVGRIALVGFVVLILAGVGLVAYDWYRKQQEKASS